MPHSNGKIYIEAPKGIDLRGDIGYVLGLNTGDLKTLYDSSNVKMWSRKKPVPWSINGTKNFNPQGSHPTDWWKGVNGDFGITSKSAETTNLLSFLDGGMNGWSYSRDSLVARALDFDGYYHEAPNPFDSLFIQMDKTSVAPSAEMHLMYSLYASGGEATADSLGIIELYAYTPKSGGKKLISSMYAAVVIYEKQSNGNYLYHSWFSADETLSDLEEDRAMHSVTFSAPSTTGNYLYVPVLTNAKKTSANQAIGDIVTIPGTSAQEFNVSYSAVPSLRVDAFVYSDSNQNPNFHNTIYFIVYLDGGTNGGTFRNISLGFRTGTGAQYLTVNNVHNQGNPGDVYVGQNVVTKLPAGSGDVYSVQWQSSVITLEQFVMELGGKARIYDATTGTTMRDYEIPIRSAAGMPSGRVIPF